MNLFFRPTNIAISYFHGLAENINFSWKYDNAKAEYGQLAYEKTRMEIMPVINGANLRNVKEFFKQLCCNVQSLDTLEQLRDVKWNVHSTLDKLKGVKADLVCEVRKINTLLEESKSRCC